MTHKYSTQQILLHWLSAIVIIWSTVTGFYAGLFHPGQATKEFIGFFNVSLTTVFIPFFIIRLVYLFAHAKPEEQQLSPTEQRLAQLGHLALYGNISAVLITGVLMMNHNIDVFHLFTIPHPLHNPAVILLFNKLHIALCVSLAALIAGHILAVAKHQYGGKNILNKMLPW